METPETHTPQYLARAGSLPGGLAPHIDLPPKPELLAQGWERRFMADPVRIEEGTRLYEELGFEVHIEGIDPSEFSEVCGDCRLATCFAYKTIYTRRPRAST